jgi:hypothetical protein
MAMYHEPFVIEQCFKTIPFLYVFSTVWIVNRCRKLLITEGLACQRHVLQPGLAPRHTFRSTPDTYKNHPSTSGWNPRYVTIIIGYSPNTVFWDGGLVEDWSSCLPGDQPPTKKRDPKNYEFINRIITYLNTIIHCTF